MFNLKNILITILAAASILCNQTFGQRQEIEQDFALRMTELAQNVKNKAGRLAQAHAKTVNANQKRIELIETELQKLQKQYNVNNQNDFLKKLEKTKDTGDITNLNKYSKLINLKSEATSDIELQRNLSNQFAKIEANPEHYVQEIANLYFKNPMALRVYKNWEPAATTATTLEKKINYLNEDIIPTSIKHPETRIGTIIEIAEDLKRFVFKQIEDNNDKLREKYAKIMDTIFLDRIFSEAIQNLETFSTTPMPTSTIKAPKKSVWETIKELFTGSGPSLTSSIIPIAQKRSPINSLDDSRLYWQAMKQRINTGMQYRVMPRVQKQIEIRKQQHYAPVPGSINSPF